MPFKNYSIQSSKKPAPTPPLKQVSLFGDKLSLFGVGYHFGGCSVHCVKSAKIILAREFVSTPSLFSQVYWQPYPLVVKVDPVSPRSPDPGRQSFFLWNVGHPPSWYCLPPSPCNSSMARKLRTGQQLVTGTVFPFKETTLVMRAKIKVGNISASYRDPILNQTAAGLVQGGKIWDPAWCKRPHWAVLVPTKLGYNIKVEKAKTKQTFCSHSWVGWSTSTSRFLLKILYEIYQGNYKNISACFKIS